MAHDLADVEAGLTGRGEAYARVTVVWSRRPTAARAGDVALVTLDGRLHGWVGGSCAEPVVVREALRALREGTPRLLHVAPATDLPPDREGYVTAPMSCASEGSLEAFVEPRLPRPHLMVIGRSPMVRALATMASSLRFDVAVVERDDLDTTGLDATAVVRGLDLARAGCGPDSFVVVATMGRYDEDAIEAALATGARYVALVASSRRATAVLGLLAQGGVADEALAKVQAPAGLDLGPLPHDEIAVAVLAEIVAEKARRRADGSRADGSGAGGSGAGGSGAGGSRADGSKAGGSRAGGSAEGDAGVGGPTGHGSEAPGVAAPGVAGPGVAGAVCGPTTAHQAAQHIAVDPVCGMTVATATATDVAAHDGATYWFCASGCRRRFQAEPERFVSSQHQSVPPATPPEG